jgi:Tfp pilus assembly protein PilX/cytoskeletal protein CcmA (bactofilin family)
MNAQFPIRNPSRRRGIALMLVVFVMALAAILGYAMLSASAVQATAGGNAVAAAVARAQAESGIHYAMYYLLKNQPATGVSWPNVTFATVSPAATIPGNVSIQIGSPTNGCYPVTATGSSGSSTGGGVVTRTITAEICVGGSYLIQQAGAFNSTVILGAQASFTSSIPNAPAVAIASGNSVTNDGAISGNVSGTLIPGSGAQTNGTVNSAPTVAPAPASSAYVYDYSQPYIYQGITCYPTQISGSTLSASPSSSPTTNPLGIYYCTGSLTVSGQVNIAGTLVVEGSLTNTGKIYITPATSTLSTNMPALVVDQKLITSGGARVLNATGVVYVGTAISAIGSTTTSNITINGALLDSGGITSYSGALSVTYNSAYTDIPSFVSIGSGQTTPWVKIISWSE